MVVVVGGIVVVGSGVGDSVGAGVAPGLVVTSTSAVAALWSCSSSPVEVAMTHTTTPTRNTNTTPITAGMLTFQRSPAGGL